MFSQPILGNESARKSITESVNKKNERMDKSHVIPNLLDFFTVKQRLVLKRRIKDLNSAR